LPARERPPGGYRLPARGRRRRPEAGDLTGNSAARGAPILVLVDLAESARSACSNRRQWDDNLARLTWR
jgi:hypothetical protein